ncbi:MAG: cation:proton antiporter [Planktothrix sp. GU0601_MAG3]|nr:MAG: cation:proton antiporter [Planktothrix sp. GU0601_MAG3]
MDVTELVRISIILLLVSTGVALFSRKIGIPYVTGLVLAGLPFSEFLSQSVGLDPVLVLNLFLPILIFEAGINTDVSRLRSTFKPIALLAGPGAICFRWNYCGFIKIWPRTRLDIRLLYGRDVGQYRYGFHDCRF